MSSTGVDYPNLFVGDQTNGFNGGFIRKAQDHHIGRIELLRSCRHVASPVVRQHDQVNVGPLA